MFISGVVVNGRVEFTEASNLPDGSEVIVDVIRPRDEETREGFYRVCGNRSRRVSTTASRQKFF